MNSNERLPKAERIQEEFMTYFRNTELKVGRGPTYDEMRNTIYDPETGERISDATLSEILGNKVGSGELVPVTYRNETHYWSPSRVEDVKIPSGAPDSVLGYSEVLEQDPYPADDGWEEVRKTGLKPLQFEKDVTPWGNRLSKWDVDMVERWAGRNDWKFEDRYEENLRGVHHVSLTTTRKRDRAVTLIYHVIDAGETEAVTLEGLFRRGPGEDFHPPATAHDKYLISVLNDLGSPDRFAKMNQMVIDAAREVGSRGEADLYREVLEDMERIDYPFQDERDRIRKEGKRQEGWARALGRLQGLINLKERGAPLPGNLRSRGKVPSIAERELDDLRGYAVAARERFDPEEMEKLRYLESAYDALEPFHDFLVDDIVRNDSSLGNRKWVQEGEDYEVLESLARGHMGGETGQKVVKKWRDHVELFERKFGETTTTKLETGR